MKSVHLVIAPGSPSKKDNRTFCECLKGIQNVLKGQKIEGAFLKFAKPRILEKITSLIRRGVLEIFIVPLGLLPLRALKNDIPAYLADIRMKYPHVTFHYRAPLSCFKKQEKKGKSR